MINPKNISVGSSIEGKKIYIGSTVFLIEETNCSIHQLKVINISRKGHEDKFIFDSNDFKSIPCHCNELYTDLQAAKTALNKVIMHQVERMMEDAKILLGKRYYDPIKHG
jgi:hypothetical protein